MSSRRLSKRMRFNHKRRERSKWVLIGRVLSISYNGKPLPGLPGGTPLYVRKREQ